jgi:hypothetical protein
MVAINTPDALRDFVVTTVTFEDVAGLDGKNLGTNLVGQPYAALGLYIWGGKVRAHANLASSSGGVAIEAEGIYAPYQTSLILQFAVPQRAVGFFYRDPRATSLQLEAYGAQSVVIEEQTFPGGAGYAGIIRPTADIAACRTLAPHHSYEEALQSRTEFDDLSFARTLKMLPGPGVEPGVVVVVLGGLRADGRGVVIGPHGVISVPPSNPAFQQVAAAAEVLAAAEGIGDAPLREEVRRSASASLRESIARFFRGQ